MSLLTPARRRALLGLTTSVSGLAVVAVLLPLSGGPALEPALLTTPATPATALPTDDPAGSATTASPRVAALLTSQLAAGLDCETTRGGLPLCVHGDDTAPHDSSDVTAASDGSTAGGGSGGQIGCYGDGTSGPRVRAVYARPEGAPNNYAATLPSIRSWAAGTSAQFDASAARTGGRRHVRFATTPGTSCSLTVLDVTLPKSAFSTFRATVEALEARGLKTAHSKYLVWADASGLCGMATSYDDDRPGLDNLNNGGLPSYARIDKRCWGQVETHELVHMLGGVQRSAPNATGGFHCNDGLDAMCYDDGTAGSAQRSVCGKDRAHVLDCRNDDYFSTAAPRGSYLQTHWNVARSSFLAATLGDPPPAASTAPSPAASPAPAATKAPVPAPPAPSTTPKAASPAPVPAVVVPALPVLPVLPTLAPALPLLAGGSR
jgi:hypothetical protein